MAMLVSARRRAKLQNIPFNIELGDIIITEKCPALGIKLEVGVGAVTNNSPTLDKIIPELGYVKGNVVVISHKANTMKRDASLEEIFRLANWLASLNVSNPTASNPSGA
jgi:hypothetical protein